MRLDHLLSMENREGKKTSHKTILRSAKVKERRFCSILRMLETVSLKQHNGVPSPCIWGCSSAGRAPALQAGGQEFDSPHLHQGTKEDEQLDVSQYCGAAKQQGDFKSLTILSRYAKHNGRIAQVVRAHA